MKRTMFKRLAALGLCCMVATSVAFAANTIKKTITVEYSGIKLVVDGVEVTPKDANGATVEPFVYNGTTYLPVRAVGNAIGKEVGWDDTTQTVYLGDIPDKPSNKNYLDPYQVNGATAYTSDPTKSFSMMGEKYTQGVVSWYENSAYYNLNGHYSMVSFEVGHVDGDGYPSKPANLYIYIDGELFQQIELTDDMQTKHIELRVNNALQMKFVFEAGRYGVANVRGIE